ncbi:MAG: ImmA/IrrE family metallo-endopeptidase [Desulfitobacteriaceae bacterium]|jgi:Zn-dependent peptidase ImmA (M78 family)|nr:ImmA/IrrE family metallo-endopeptidase [Desulfitobacteriaceae bacterium]
MSDKSPIDVQYLDLSPEVSQDLEQKAREKLACLCKSLGVLKEDVLNILADTSTFIQYPIEDDEICGFVCRKERKTFSFINSYVPYEKQLFAAAHELYHIWYDEEVLNNGEVLDNNMLDPISGVDLEEREIKANRFAAILMVPTDILRNELDYRKIKVGDEISLEIIVKLMSKFGMPYKTIVRRLYEVQYIDPERCLELLKIQDRGEKSPIRMLQKRLQTGEEQNHRSKIIKFNGLVDKAITAYEKKLISSDKLKYLLSIVRKQPSDFCINIESSRLSEEDLLELLENE